MNFFLYKVFVTTLLVADDFFNTRFASQFADLNKWGISEELERFWNYVADVFKLLWTA